MRKVLFAVIIAVIISGCAKSINLKPDTFMTIEDEVYFHNASITSDSKHLFTLNGGNSDWAVVNEYDLKGNLLKSYNPPVDGRSFFYNMNDKQFYVKPYDISLYTVDLNTDEVILVDNHWWSYWDENSSLGFSQKADKVFERIENWIYVIDFESGMLADSFEVEAFDEHPYNLACAASEKYVYTWAGVKKVNAYSHDGKFAGQIQLPREGYGFSLSYCNGMLWISKDADANNQGGMGYWYGYKIE